MTTTMKPLVLYHDGCADGACAAWVCWLATGKKIEPVAVNYGQPPPTVEGRDVWIVDFSYPREVLLDMKAKATSLGVIDHHRTAQQDLADLWFCVFDMNRSGAQIAWDNFMSEPRPAIVDYVGDRDLWRWELPESKQINAWIRCNEWTVDRFDWMSKQLETNREACVAFGQGALADVESYVRSMKKNARVVDFLGHQVPVVNAPGPNASELLGSLAEDGYPFAVGFFQRADGRWQYSLRSRGDFDVSSIAKQFGGGGHKAAAGFEHTYDVDGLLRLYRMADNFTRVTVAANAGEP